MKEYLPETFAPLPFAPIHQGEFSVTIAQTQAEVIEAQALRYQVFCGEMGATLSPEAMEAQRDGDAYDTVCDHLLVRYHPSGTQLPKIIGTYRMLRSDVMPQIGQYYSENEYDISALKHTGKPLLEMGRSCTHPQFRNKVAMQLLWRGIGEYIMHHEIAYLFGCASFEGVDADAHAQALSYLYQHHLADATIRPRTLDQHYVNMQRADTQELDAKKIFFKLPILVKGYLRLGAVVGDGAFIDHGFNTTDILIIVETHKVSEKHLTRYAPDSVTGGEA